MKRYAEYKDSGIEWIGEIPREWSVVPIKRILSAIQDGTHATFARVADGIPLLSAKNVSDDGVEISESESLISESDFDAIVSNGFPMYGDVLLCCVGTIGRCCIYTFETQMAFQRSVSFLRVNGKMTNQFLLYSLKSIALIRQMVAFANSSAQSGIYMGIVKSLMLSLPPVLIQQQIVTHLDRKTAAVDALIADKQKLVELLQEKRSAVISEAVTKGLDKTAKMKDSGIEWIGDVPVSWHVSRIGFETWVRARLGWKGLKAEEYVDEGYAFLSTPNIKNTLIDFENVNYISKERYDESPEIKINIGDVLLAKDGSTLGTVNVVRSLPKETTVNSSIAVITPSSRINSVYLYYLFQSDYLKSIIQMKKGGMGVPHLFQGDIVKFSIPLPPLDEQESIAFYLDQKTTQIDTLISDINEQIEQLKEYRQAVISEAVTGKVAV